MTQILKIEPVAAYACYADIGCAAIRAGGAAFAFNNGYGDGPFTVFVYDKAPPFPSEWFNYVSLFEVGQDSIVDLLDYDCSGGKPVHRFGPGRWQVFNDGHDVHVFPL